MKQTPQQKYEQKQYKEGLRQYKRWIPKSWFKILDKKIEELKG